MTVWPGTLPQSPLLDGFEETAPDTSLRSSMDAGPAKVRRRSTANVYALPMQFMMTDAQVTALRTFYVTTLGSGALAFDFTHPRTAATISVRFDKPPSWSFVGIDKWLVNCSFEVLP